jgi:aminoglycoside phosphotransferase (APT) family kinase protein
MKQSPNRASKDTLDQAARKLLIACQGDREITAVQTVQSLWSDYGQLLRVSFASGEPDSVIVKYVRPPDAVSHPRGWSSTTGDQRKRRSYQVEAAWYQHHAVTLPPACRVPASLGVEVDETGSLTLIMEDLEPEFPHRLAQLDPDSTLPCLDWLAALHASQLQVSAPDLWPIGCYWHLGTRADELAAMADGPLKRAASTLDHRLTASTFQTLIHGDAKLANFCFSTHHDQVAAVDFQYVGRGPGVRDLAYFLGSALDEATLITAADSLTDVYFARLRAHLPATIDQDALEADWRALLPIAVADFERFLAGWAPGHYKRNRWSAALSERALADITKDNS